MKYISETWKKFPLSLPAYHKVMFYTSRDYPGSFCPITPQYWRHLVTYYFFSCLLSTTSLVLPKNDWNTEDKMQSYNTFLVFGIYHMLHRFPVTTSNQRSPVSSASVLKRFKTQKVFICTTTNWYSAYSLVVIEQKSTLMASYVISNYPDCFQTQNRLEQ